MPKFPQHPANTPLLSPLNDLEIESAARLFRHVDFLAGLIGPRHMLKPTTIEATTTYIRRTLNESGYDCDTQKYQVGDQWAENIVVEIRGSSRPGEIVVVGAHYDTVTKCIKYLRELGVMQSVR